MYKNWSQRASANRNIIQRSTTNLRPKDRARFNRKSKSSRSIFERIQLISGQREGGGSSLVASFSLTSPKSAKYLRVVQCFSCYARLSPVDQHVFRVSR